MRVGITGGTGFVGRHVAIRLSAAGHEAVLVARGHDRGADAIIGHAGIRLVRAGVGEPQELEAAFAGCSAIVHCAGINREIGPQTYDAVHVRGTAAVAAAGRRAGVDRLVMLSFLRARPDGPSAYHRSKWAAEEIVRTSDLTHTVVKAGVIHGRGDHMLDHLCRAFQTFPVFALVGLQDRPVRPVAVDEVAALLAAAALGDDRLANRTFAALGPEELPLSQAVRRVADVVGRRPIFVRLPVAGQMLVASIAEWTMTVPLVSRAQVRILAEAIVEPLPFADWPPSDLAPSTAFTEAAISAGLPDPGGFGRRDLRWCAPDLEVSR
jgi:NADH dehydrogenase